MPLVLGPDGERLAKRHGAVTLADRAALGQSAADVRASSRRSSGSPRRGERSRPAALVERFSVARPAGRGMKLASALAAGGRSSSAAFLARAGHRFTRPGSRAAPLLVGAGLSVWLLNMLFRIGVSGDRERDEEDRAATTSTSTAAGPTRSGRRDDR